MPTENKKLRSLLREAQEDGMSPDLYERIDAALAEPVEPSESEYAMHARIRADYDKTVADCWRAKVAEVERERDEARAEVKALCEAAEDLMSSMGCGCCGHESFRDNEAKLRDAIDKAEKAMKVLP